MSTEAKEAPAAAAAPAGGGGIKAMLPLIINLVLMPAVAFALTQFVLLPKLKAPAPAAHGAAGEGEEAHAAEEGGGHGGGEGAEAKEDAHGGAAKEDSGHGGGGGDAHGGGGGKAAKGGKAPVSLSSKILVNVSGTMGSRFLQAHISVVGGKKNLASLVEEFDAQLRDAASSVLAAKTLADLEKTGSRNLIKAELVGAFNHILGQGSVTDVFLTDFAIQ